MATFLPEFMQELKQRNNLVDVVASYVSLDRKGENYWACCPFHHEKTPSFSVNASEQFYHCFGCGVSGDVVKFVQNMENVDFPDAVKILARRAGMPLPKEDMSDERTVALKKKRDTLLSVLKDTARFYWDNLNSGNADAHIHYILERKMTARTVKCFGLGASLDFESLPRYLREKGYSEQDMLDSGVCGESKGKIFDAEAGRLIFPIINAFGDVIAFGGRLMEKKPNFAKYKNTKETMVFNKRTTLYNVNLLKKLKKEQAISSVIMAEGYMDVISLYQAGFRNVVASMGTSLTQEQARLVKRYTSNCYISYDGDAAGQHAAIRGLEIMQGEGVNVKVVPLPDGLDPDDVCKQFGAQGYQDCLDRAKPLVDFKISVAAREHDPKNPDERGNYIAAVLKIVREVETESEKETLLKRLREETGITYESLKRDLEGLPSVPLQKSMPVIERKDNADFLKKAARFILAAVLFSKRYARDVFLEGIPFEDPVHLDLVDYLCDKRDAGETPSPSQIFDLFDSDQPEINAILQLNDGVALEGEQGEKYFNDSIRVLKRYELEKQIKELNDDYAKSLDVEERKRIAYRIQELTKALKK